MTTASQHADHQTQCVSSIRSVKARTFEEDRSPRASLAVVALSQSSVTILRRLRASGFSSVSVFEHVDSALREAEAHAIDTLLVLLEPELFSREQLHRADVIGVRVLGVVAHKRHRLWATLLPLNETVWLYAPHSAYRRALSMFWQRTRGFQSQ